MKDSITKPELALKKLWILMNLIVFGLGLVVGLAMFFFKIELIIVLIFCSLLLIGLVWVLLYIPAFFKTLEYRVTGEGVNLKKGVFWKINTIVPYTKITNIDVTQGPLERAFGISKIHVQTAGASGQQNTKAELVMSGISDPTAISELIKKGIYNEKLRPEIPIQAESQNPDSVLSAILAELKGLREDMRKA